jgi:ATP-dependent Clp protease ATP-binding subunit ClpC
VLIMTSNLGTEFIRRGGTLGFLQNEGTTEDKEANQKIEKALKGTFRPEFLNRIDEVIVFSPLTLEQMYEIVDLQMDEIRERLAEHGLKVELTKKAREWLAKEGFDPSLGARPLKRTLQKYVESPLSISLLSGDFKEGDKVVVDLNETDAKLVFTKK